MARLGTPYCPACDIPIGTQTADEIIDKIMAEPAGTKLYLMAPLEIDVGEKYETLWDEIRAPGYVRMRVDGQTHSIDQPPQIDRRRKHAVEVVIDRVIVRPDARCRIAGSVENALALGKGVLHVAYPDEDVPEAALAHGDSQPALRLRSLRAQLRAADAAQFFVQQLAGLVPGLRRAGHADRRQPGGPAARPEADLGPGGRRPLARGALGRVLGDARGTGRARGRAARRAVRPVECQAAPRRLSRHRRRVDRRVRRSPTTREGCREWAAAAVPLPVQGAVSGAGGGRAAVAGAAGQVGAPGRRSRMLDLRRQPAARRRLGGAAARADDRRAVPPAVGRPAGAVRWLDARYARAKDRRRAGARSAQSAAIPGRRGLGISDARPRRPRRSRAARRSASAWPARSAAACAACSTCSTSRRSACTRATIAACWGPRKAPRLGQHAVGRRARPRSGRGGRPTARLRPGGRRGWRPDRRPRHAGASCQTDAARSPGRICRARRRSRADEPADAEQA